MTDTESKGLKKGTRVYWQGDAADSGVITETSWDAVTIAWNNGQVALLQTASDFVQFLRQALSFARATSTHERVLLSGRVSLIYFSSVSPFVGIDVCSL